MTKRVLILQHVPWEKPGLIATALMKANVPFEIRTVLNETSPEIPPITDLAGLVLMGGPMGATDTGQYPGLSTEQELVRQAVDAHVPVLGVCLGHQIIATTFGAELHPAAAQEFGIAPIDTVAVDDFFSPGASQLEVLHWHRDVVDLPSGAKLLASTTQCPNQAFRLGSAVGFNSISK